MMDRFTQSRLSPLAGAAINAASNRRAMGFPEHFEPGRFDECASECRALVGLSPGAMAEVVEDASRPLGERLAAGRLLALLGDPRIQVYSPSMMNVPGGEVTIGLDESKVNGVVADLRDAGVLKEWIDKECPAHSVRLGSYRIGKYPVTNLEYREFLADTCFDELPTSWFLGFYPAALANHPVFTISELGAEAYARWLSEKTRRRFRLPTEAEWEHAAAGADRREYPWGDVFLEDCANTIECGLGYSSPVGAFPKGLSAFGVSDMAGNVEEYVACNYRPYPGAPMAVADDLARALGDYRVARGGSFTRYRDLARCKRRHGGFPKPIYVMGFRLAEDP